MRLRWWESLALSVPLLVGLRFLLAEMWLPGVVLLALVVFTAASRAHVVEQDIAGFHARVRGRLLLVRAISLVSIYIALVGLEAE